MQIKVQIPKDLGLTEEQIKELQQKFASLLIDAIEAGTGKAIVEARKTVVSPKAMASTKVIEVTK